jgi:hypothetical protein
LAVGSWELEVRSWKTGISKPSKDFPPIAIVPAPKSQLQTPIF